MRLEGEGEEEEQDTAPEVCVEDPAPVGADRHGIDHVFDIELVETEGAEPDGDPPVRLVGGGVRCGVEGGVRRDVKV